MRNNVVKYSNDFYKMKICRFNALEQNILYGILANLREHRLNTFELTAEQILDFMPSKNMTRKELFKEVVKLRDSFFKLDFEVIKPLENNKVRIQYYNLFSIFDIGAVADYTDINSAELLDISVKLNPDFENLLFNLSEHFTQFKLEEFIFLSGKYTKNLYVNLKQFRTTGIWRVKINDFLELMDIPKSYRMRDIDRQILEPSIKQLQEPLNLFERARTPFKNLKYRKIKGKGRGRGGAVTQIEFTFDKQTAQGEPIANFMGQEIAPSPAKEYKEPQKLEPIFIQRLRDIQKKKAIIYNNQEYFILNIVKQDEHFLIYLSTDAKFPKNDFYAKFSLERAEQLAKDNNLI